MIVELAPWKWKRAKPNPVLPTQPKPIPAAESPEQAKRFQDAIASLDLASRHLTAKLISATAAQAEEIPSMSFIAKFKSEFSRLFHALPTWQHTAITVVNFAAPVVDGLAAIYDPAALPVIDPILTRIKTDLATASVLIGDGTATPTLASTLTSIQTNLQAILSAAQIKDATKQSEINATLNLIIGEFQAVQADLPKAA